MAWPGLNFHKRIELRDFVMEWLLKYKLSRGEIVVANFKAPCEWCNFGQVFNDQLGHLFKLGDWKTAESCPMLKFFGQNHLKSHFSEKFILFCPIRPKNFWPNPMAGCWDNWEFIGHRVTELQTPKGTQYMGGWNFFGPDFNKLPYLLRSQGDN